MNPPTVAERIERSERVQREAKAAAAEKARDEFDAKQRIAITRARTLKAHGALTRPRRPRNAPAEELPGHVERVLKAAEKRERRKAGRASR